MKAEPVRRMMAALSVENQNVFVVTFVTRLTVPATLDTGVSLKAELVRWSSSTSLKRTASLAFLPAIGTGISRLALVAQFHARYIFSGLVVDYDKTDAAGGPLS